MASGSRRFTSPENGRILDLLFSEVSVSMYAVRYEGLICIPYALLAWNHLVTAFDDF